MSKHKAIKEELFLIKKFLETSEGRKVRPDDYMNNRTFMSDVYHKLSKEVKNDLEYCLFKLHKSKTILNKLADSVIERSAEKGIDKNDNKEENKMSKKNKEKENVLVIGEHKKEKKKHKTTEDIDDIIKELKEMKSDDDTTKMAMEESKKEKKHKDSAKSEKSSKNEDMESDVKKSDEINDMIDEYESIFDDEEDEYYNEDEKEKYSKFDNIMNDIDTLLNERAINADDIKTDTKLKVLEDDVIYINDKEIEEFEKRLDRFDKINKSFKERKKKFQKMKNDISNEKYESLQILFNNMEKKLNVESDYLCEKNIQFFREGRYS